MPPKEALLYNYNSWECAPKLTASGVFELLGVWGGRANDVLTGRVGPAIKRNHKVGKDGWQVNKRMYQPSSDRLISWRCTSPARGCAECGESVRGYAPYLELDRGCQGTVANGIRGSDSQGASGCSVTVTSLRFANTFRIQAAVAYYVWE